MKVCEGLFKHPHDSQISKFCSLLTLLHESFVKNVSRLIIHTKKKVSSSQIKNKKFSISNSFFFFFLLLVKVKFFIFIDYFSVCTIM